MLAWRCSSNLLPRRRGRSLRIHETLEDYTKIIEANDTGPPTTH
jgi:hypothetical protein